MKKSYYAVIPANVRYDKRLTANAKLIYGEITALCNERGYCWARNSYFAELYNVSKKSVSTWINQLIEFGYIYSEIKYVEGTKEIENRYLKLTDTPISLGSEPMEENFHTPTEENFHTPMEKNFHDNNTCINNTFINKVSKKKGDAKTAKKKTKKENKKIDEPNCKKNNRESFDEIIESYVRYAENDLVLENLLKEFLKMLAMKNKLPTNDTLKRNLSELFDYGKGNKYLMREIVERTNNGCWNKFFPLNADDEQKIIEEYTN